MEEAIVFLPLVAAIIVGLRCGSISTGWAQFLTCGATSLSAIFAGFVFYDVVILQQPVIIDLVSWIQSGDFAVNWTLRIDSLTAIMLIVVTWVSALVHIYSIGYMSHYSHIPRFMAYLSLFTFFMLMLITSDNFLQLFLGWEGVGLCSYLLIGFWFKKPAANNAAIKAFIVNRVGDFGFALGILAIFLLFGSIQFSEVFEIAHLYEDRHIEFLGIHFHALTLICILLFIGAMGKSAQIGLHTWLPDAMEGPTPVSALIHAATMVTAGVFMVARCSPLFELSPIALGVVTVVGAVTCLFAATIAITQNDIKRVIAYSTCSQLGYMFFACGVSAYSAGIFHLATHGFFKALLFLGAGSVIHAMSDEQDMRKMGGLWRKIPFTYATMIVGTLAITGVPFLSGYYSKDIIIESAYAAGHHGNWTGTFAFWMGIVAATLTAFYSWRLIFMTFHGTSRADANVLKSVHESPRVMTYPLLLLSIGALGAGWYLSTQLGVVDADLKFWNNAIVMLGVDNVLEAAHHVPSWVIFSPLVVGIIGLAVAYLCYLAKPEIPSRIADSMPVVYKFLHNKWYFDELYDYLFVQPSKRLGTFLWQKVDIGTIDFLGPNGFAGLSQKVGQAVSKFQTGYVFHYAFVMLIGIVGAMAWYIYQMEQ